MDEMQREISDLRRELSYVKHDYAILEWALTGLISRKVKIVSSSGEINPDAYEQIAKGVAHQLLREARLNFNSAAMLAELTVHVKYLEGRAEACGVPFEKFRDRGKTTIYQPKPFQVTPDEDGTILPDFRANEGG